jgi:hypothetical protein
MMFVVTEAQAATIRTAYEQRDECRLLPFAAWA